VAHWVQQKINQFHMPSTLNLVHNQKKDIKFSSNNARLWYLVARLVA
jgi:hypothetical protein